MSESKENPSDSIQRQRGREYARFVRQVAGQFGAEYLAGFEEVAGEALKLDILARALFDSDPAVHALLNRVADHVVQKSDGVWEMNDGCARARQRCWEIDDKGLRSQAFTRAGAVLFCLSHLNKP
jgi:hypothetical protein